jgi:hypothetical protein
MKMLVSNILLFVVQAHQRGNFGESFCKEKCHKKVLLTICMCMMLSTAT